MPSSVVHFMPEEDDRTACGAQVFLCDEYTDNPEHVGCGRCKQTKRFKDYDPRRFNIDVWNWEGDVIRWAKHVTAQDVEMYEKEYADNPSVQVVVEQVV